MSFLRSLFTKSNNFRLAAGYRRYSPSISRQVESNILRILGNEIQYLRDYAPPFQPATNYGKYIVEDQPGEKWIKMKCKSADAETIEIEASMFDDFILAPPRPGHNESEDIQLHISVLIDVSKEQGSECLGFVCSAWPDSLEIQKVYTHNPAKSQPQLYTGPQFRGLSNGLQQEFSMFLRRRGLDDELSKFLHSYMMNKDKIELIKWLEKTHSHFEFVRR